MREGIVFFTFLCVLTLQIYASVNSFSTGFNLEINKETLKTAVLQALRHGQSRELAPPGPSFSMLCVRRAQEVTLEKRVY